MRCVCSEMMVEYGNIKLAEIDVLQFARRASDVRRSGSEIEAGLFEIKSDQRLVLDDKHANADQRGSNQKT